MDALSVFSEPTRAWFESSFAAPTPAQEQGWPAIASGKQTLIQAPTGSGTAGQWVKFQVCSTTAQTVTWDTGWGGQTGLPLPSQTTGGSQCDLWLYQYNAFSAKLTLVADVGRQARACQPTLTPGTYTNANLTVDAGGCLSAVSSGVGGGGSASAAGLQGDVQVAGLSGAFAADSGKFTHDLITHWTTVQQLLVGAGSAALALNDPHGYTLTQRVPSLSANQQAYWPNRTGVVAVTDGGTPTHLAVFASDGVGLVDGGVPGVGAGGDVSSNTSTSVDGEIALFNSTTGKSIKRAIGTGLAKVTAGVFSTTASPIG